MARNRKNQPTAVRLGPLFRVIVICSLIAASGVGYVWQKDQLNELSRRKVELEKRLWRLRVQNAQAGGQLMQLHSSPALEARVKELGLGLIEPAPAQIVRLIEPAPGAGAGAGRPALVERQYARQEPRAEPEPKH
jgi:hypothetical protein